MKRAAVYLIVATIAAPAALCGALAWRLAQGPIDVPLATSYLARGLSSDGGPTVRIRGTELVWNRSQHDLLLRARDVELRGATGAMVGVLPSLTVGLSLRALLHGVIAPAEVVAQGLRLRLVLQPGGGIDLGLGTGAEGPLFSSPRSAAERLFGASSPRGSSAWLRTVVLRHGQIDLVDARDGSSWQARDVDLVLRPAGAIGLDAELTGLLAFGPNLVPIRMEATVRHGPERVEIGLAFRGLDPSALGSSMPGGSPPVLQVLSGLRLPLDGRIALMLDATLAPRRARLKLRGGPGTVEVASIPGRALAIARLRAALAVDLDEDRVRLQHVSLEMGRGALRARGELRGLRDEGSADLAVSVTGVPVDDIGRYWPEKMAAGARRWVVDNVRGGRVDRASMRVTGRVGHALAPPFALGTLAGSFVFDGLTVRYLPAMSPATGVAGTGSFSERGLRFRVARGNVGGLQLVHATVDIPGSRGPTVAIDGSVRGPLGEAIALLEQQPSLALSRTVGVVPRDVAGTMTARITLAVPLRGTPDLRAMRPSVSAELQGLSVAGLPRGWTLTDGDFTVNLTGGSIAANGRGRLQGVPATFVWQQDLEGGRRTLDLQGDVDASRLAALGFDGLPAFDGEMAVQARYAASASGAARVTMDLDLARVAIDSSAPALRKRSGTPGTGRAVLTLSGAAVSAVDGLELVVGGTRVTGSGTLSGDGTRWQTIDARAVLAADVGPPGGITLKLAPDGRQSRLTIASDDAGRLAAALGARVEVVGGRLVFAGSWDLAAPGWPIEGPLDVGTFKLTRAPVLGRAASLVSLSGVASALSGKGGIEFDWLRAELIHRNGVITIKSARASGRSLGVFVRGVVDYTAGTLALEGSLVPAYYGLNQAAGRVPIVGRVLTGTRKEGVQVFDFQAKGPLASPVVTARASSAAPGVMRDLLRQLDTRPKQ